MPNNITITDNSATFIETKNDAIERILTEIGLQLEGEAKTEIENAPSRVDTGLLRNSITYAVDGHTPAITQYHSDPGKEAKNGLYFGSVPEEKNGGAVYIGTNVEYAPYVHEGTRNMEPNRFIANAVRKNADQIRNKIKQALKG